MSQSPEDQPDLDALVDNVVKDQELPSLPTPKPLTEAEQTFITFMHQNYSLHGHILSKQAADDLIGIPADEYDKLMADSRIVMALDERGVVIKSPVGKSAEGSVISISDWQQKAALNTLTPSQLVVANTMLDLIDTRSQKKKLQDLNVSTTTYNTWLKDPVFQDYLRQRAESMLGENQHEAHLALLDKVRMGDMKALEFYYEMTGQYTRASATGQNANSVAVDIQNLLVRILEIINDEVDDPQTAANIADRFKELMVARTIAGELVSNEIIQPKIAQAREITPEIQVLMDKGQGYE